MAPVARSEQCPLTLARGDPPRIMAILNATPDSFSGDGLAHRPTDLVALAEAHVRAGADLLDLGGESTRPGSVPVSADEELRRVIPVLQAVALRLSVPISIDTQKPSVAARALEAGAGMINDVSGLRDPELPAVAAAHHASLVLTHNGWTMGRARSGTDILSEVVDALRRLVDVALAAGVSERRLVADPGLGFGKSPLESLELLRRSSELREALAPLPVLIGASRKSFIGRALGLPVQERLEGSLACVALAAFAGAELIRVHDVSASARVARMAWAVRQGQRATLTPEPSASSEGIA